MGKVMYFYGLIHDSMQLTLIVLVNSRNIKCSHEMHILHLLLWSGRRIWDRFTMVGLWSKQMQHMYINYLEL